MPRDEENYVALFIDWDNLAISTSVDFAGAVPDVRAIVRAAQRSGTILVARAYAEWNVSSDRLSVYRAGVEPVYAPTFRFEPEPGSSVPRGKSLADPCLVTDCIDLMHLMPEISVFVLVSGDKDLIPIVRIAQLRGRRVVVIGPDFVAAILREMADEYIPYRTLVDLSDTNGAAEVSPGPRGSRQVRGGQSRATQLASPNVQRSAPIPPPPRPVAATPAPAPRLPSDVNGSAAVDIAAATAVPEAAIETVPVDEQIDPAPLWDMISTIVRDREAAGKPPLRATNLKDQLLARISGFNERKYGFARFKDLLAVAEKAGVIVVNRNGPVQWVAAPSKTASSPTSPPVPPAAPAPVREDPLVPSATIAPFVAEEVAFAAPSSEEDVDADVVRFIIELRDRSRWLTYTYLLTNLLDHLGKGSADAAADAAARTTLNRLVQSGVLVVDREPREIDVNGTRHRVRLCHIVADHPLVASIVAQTPAPLIETAPEYGESVAPAEPLNGVEALDSVEARIEASQEDSIEAAPVARREVPATVSDVVEVTAEVVHPTPVPDDLPAAAVPAFEKRPTRVVETPAPAEAAPTDEVAAIVGSVEEESTGLTPVSEGIAVNENGHAAVTPPQMTLTESFQVLRDVVREATGPNRPSTGPAAVKNRLVRRLGSFDERNFGFSKFKDYLLSAERAGVVKVELAGSTARVSLPVD